MKASTKLRLLKLAILFPFVALIAVVGGVLFHAQGGFAALRVPQGDATPVATDAATLAHGEYLARLGNCVTCHTTRGGTPYAGGRAFRSDYGTLYSTNLTPDATTGLGDWSLAEFRHAMREGASREGLLYPAFPFDHFKRLTDEDLAALFAFLRQLPAVDAPRTPNALDFPASSRRLLLAWRMLFHRPHPFTPEPSQSEAWNRGRYLVDGLGHCAMCHSGRGAMASLPADRYLAGGRILGQNWYAPPLDTNSLARWSVDDLAGYLRHGVSKHGAAYGPMAEVIYVSLRHLREDDAVAMATYLKTVPAAPAPVMSATERDLRQRHAAGRVVGTAGRRLYAEHCESCHGDDGRGRGLDYPPLAGNPHVVADDPVNSIRLVLAGGIPPTTPGNPRPHSMPPFSQVLDDAQIADVLNHVRSSWGNEATAIAPGEVRALRGSTLD